MAIYDHFADVDMEALTGYLKTSQIQTIHLGCQDNIFLGGEGLTSQGLQYLTDVLPETQLTALEICFPKVEIKELLL